MRVPAQGGLPNLANDFYYIWALEIEIFPPFVEVFPSRGHVTAKVLDIFSKSKTLKQSRQSIIDFAEKSGEMQESFFQIPFSLICLDRVSEAMRANEVSRWKVVADRSLAAVPYTTVRWKGFVDFRANTIHMMTNEARVYSLSGKVLVPTEEFLEAVFLNNAKYLGLV
jgi:hypothetical protein